MLTIVAALIVAGAVALSARTIAHELRAARHAKTHERTAAVAAMLVPGIVAAAEDPRTLLAWQPIAMMLRKQQPDVFRELDRAAGGTFPFSTAQIEAAHAQWTASWLAWEQAHDSAYKLKAAEAAAQMAAAGGSTLARARADAVEREKLELYQQRYSEYIRIARALQALLKAE